MNLVRSDFIESLSTFSLSFVRLSWVSYSFNPLISFSYLFYKLFYKVLELSGASGRGLRQSSFGRFILDDLGGHFEAHLGSFLDGIFGILYANIVILMHDMMPCSMILYDALVYHDCIKHFFEIIWKYSVSF